MTYEPFEPFEYSEPLVNPPSTVLPSRAQHPHYFDRTGVLWIVACLGFAFAAGQLLPLLSPASAVPTESAVRHADSKVASVPQAQIQVPARAADTEPHLRGVGQEAVRAQANATAAPVVFRQF